MRSLAASLAFAGFCGACATAPLPYIDPGNRPEQVGQLPENYQALVEADLRRTLKDPYSAVIVFGEPERRSCSTGDDQGHEFHGWAVPIRYNAKNAYGGYVGEEPLVYWFAEGKIQRVSVHPVLCRR